MNALRIISVTSFFLLSLLCLLPAPTSLLWYVSILVTEFPWVFVPVSMLLLWWIYKAKKHRLILSALGILTFIFFISPITRAYLVASNLKENLQTAFGFVETEDPVLEKSPFHLSKMITGIGAKQLPYETLEYSISERYHLTLDYYQSQNNDSLNPCVIVIHGGSWASGNSSQLPELNTVLAEHGYNVATINYRLAPKYTYPSQIEDITAALNYLKKNAGKSKIDTTKFVLLGRSAGAQLALDAAYNLNDPGIKGVINFYGPADMVWGYQNPANPLVLDSKGVMEDFLGGTEREVPENYRRSSASYAVTSSSVPTLIIHGKNDPLVAYEHSIRLNDSLAQKNIPHYFLSLPWATHGCDYTLNGPSGQLATYSVLYFLNRTLR